MPVDLPAGDDTAGLDAYVDVAIRAAVGLGPVRVVAQSMGGLTAPLLGDRLDVVELVLLNAMIPAPGETGGEWWTNTRHEEAVDGPDDVDMDAYFFFHDVPADLVEQAADGPEFEQSERPFADPWPLAAWPDIATRVVVGSDDRFFPPAFQRRIAEERLGLPVEQVPGGHLAALSQPVAVADAVCGPTG